ncbi:hypothetical protein GJ744_008733 [Endocarpon pusillum]|uniref:Clr5 domain-containing protein n=1 Tax=Endocarpon pusillum TaxID=364733 RepID=A0A8H7ATV4_9EURO|nr:hypothetical protein GJ744_008733 [Endocarpon pusillum]
MPKNPAPTSEPPSKDIHTTEEWEEIRNDFTNLYKDEDMPLRKIRETFAQRGFHATIPQYKRRIRRWKIDKNNKEYDMVFAGQKLAARKLQGKETVFKIRGQVKPSHEVERYWKRRQVRPRRLSPVPSTPPDVRYFTPAPSSPGPLPSLDASLAPTKALASPHTSYGKPTLVSPTNRNHNLHTAESNFGHDDDLPYQGVLNHLAYPTSTVQEFAGHLIDPTKSPAMLDEWFGIYRKISLSPQRGETRGTPSLIAMDAINSPLSLQQNTPEEKALPQDHILHLTKDELHEDSHVSIDELPAEGYPKNFLAWSIYSWLLKNECRHDESQSAMRFAASIFAKMIACRHERCLTSLELLMALIESHGNPDFANDLLDRFKATALSMSGLPEKKSIILAIKFKIDIVRRLGIRDVSYLTALEQVYADFEQYWGADSPSTLACLYNLGWYLAGDNDPDQLKKGEEILT